MTLWAVIPAKDPAKAKSRLASLLSVDARRELSLCLLQHTLRVLGQLEHVTQRLVISAADAPLALALQNGVIALREDPLDTASVRAEGGGGDGGTDRNLNAALQQAATYATHHGATALLILPADLPYVRPEAVQRLLDAFNRDLGMLIVPDHQRSGTNALLVRLPLALPFCFGKNSLGLHLEAAAQHAVRSCEHEDKLLALDLDTPEDLRNLLSNARRADSYPHECTAVVAGCSTFLECRP